MISKLKELMNKITKTKDIGQTSFSGRGRCPKGGWGLNGYLQKSCKNMPNSLLVKLLKSRPLSNSPQLGRETGLLHFVRNDNTRKKVAFTLAEVLITLGIIGVVAALTLPTLNRKIQNQILVTKIKKEYATIQQAFLKMKADSETDSIKEAMSHYFIDGQGCDSRMDPNSDECKSVLGFLGKYLKISSIEPLGTYKKIRIMWDSDRHRWGVGETVSGYKIVLSDGSYILNYSWGSWSSKFYIDVNGDKGPNGFGKDVYWFTLTDNDRRFDFSGINQDFGALSRTCDKSKGIITMYYCGAYLKKNNWVMDY